ncbi:cell separation protein [Lactobacillus helveticus]|uniref:Cell separation protein n=3 Tax=Lactobacillus helveticus TaxID=1587 RepID=A0AAU8XS62_LACHE|nr:cell separation protein [Lactobacillus helveticus]PXZ14946.1 cell separation protein [Lactobacillus helveticus]PXZ16143.1 cell separation protein [Lactobacillus helveticus]PXZ24005.1 cell separation protein [Lactobacillus helveticus]PXZ27379.1 cell separation protein [Lactobacillus helveticus]
MKLSHKLVLVSAAVLMGVSPVVGMANSASVQAAPIAHAKGVHNTYGKNSRVKMTKTMKFVDRYGKKTSKTATKGGHYTIWNVKNINGEVYYSIQTDLKHWIPAAATEGTVTYKSGNTTYTLKSNGKKVVTSTSTAKSTKKSAKKVVKKTTKKTAIKSESKKDSKKTTTKKSASTRKSTSKKTASSKKTTSKKTTSNTIKLIHNAYVYDKNGKRLKTYMGSAKYTTIAKGVTVNSNGTKTIDGVLYYSLGGGAYIKAANVDDKAANVDDKAANVDDKAANVDDKAATSSSTEKTSSKTTSKKNTSSEKNTSSDEESEDSTSVKLIHNAYVYDENGKRVKNYLGTSYIGKGVTVKGLGTKTIKGTKYYALKPNHYYVKGSDVTVK